MTNNGMKIGVDLGTANTLVYINGYGVIFNQPSIVAFDRETGELIAAGSFQQNTLNIYGNEDTNAITFYTDELGPVTIIGPGAGKRETGFSLLIDLLTLNRKIMTT